MSRFLVKLSCQRNMNRQLVINDWKISKKRHAHYYGQVVTVPCSGDVRVIRGKPTWIPLEQSQWFRTSPITKWNRNSADELVSVETLSKHTYIMGTKYKKQAAAPLIVHTDPTPVPAQPTTIPAVIIAQPATTPPLATVNSANPAATGYDLSLSVGKSPQSLLSISGPDETMEIIVDPAALPNPAKEDSKK